MTSRTIHTDLLFDPLAKKFLNNVSIKVDESSGAIRELIHRDANQVVEVADSDIDLRGKVVLPGFVDSHTHIFLHSYE